MSKTGIIYKLVSRDINVPELYVGSTCSFRARKAQHKKRCNNENDKKYKYNVYQYIRANGGWDLFDMIQIEELLRTNVLSGEEQNDLIDLKKSIEQDGKSHNLELLSSLIENCRDTIKEKSHSLHDIAKKKVQL